MKQMFKSTSKVPNEATLPKLIQLECKERESSIATHWRMER